VLALSRATSIACSGSYASLVELKVSSTFASSLTIAAVLVLIWTFLAIFLAELATLVEVSKPTWADLAPTLEVSAAAPIAAPEPRPTTRPSPVACPVPSERR